VKRNELGYAILHAHDFVALHHYIWHEAQERRATVSGPARAAGRVGISLGPCD
jgi:hypothetical protein